MLESGAAPDRFTQEAEDFGIAGDGVDFWTDDEESSEDEEGEAIRRSVEGSRDGSAIDNGRQHTWKSLEWVLQYYSSLAADPFYADSTTTSQTLIRADGGNVMSALDSSATALPMPPGTLRLTH